MTFLENVVEVLTADGPSIYSETFEVTLSNAAKVKGWFAQGIYNGFQISNCETVYTCIISYYSKDVSKVYIARTSLFEEPKTFIITVKVNNEVKYAMSEINKLVNQFDHFE